MNSGAPPNRFPGWLIGVLGCCGGCAVLAIIVIVAVGGLGMKALFAPKVPPPPAYVGVWQGSDNTVLAIGSDGVASYRSRHVNGGMNSSSSVTGGRITIDRSSNLNIKIAGIGESWRIYTPPHEVNSVTQMKLNGIVFKKIAASSTGLLSPGNSTSASQ